MNINTQNYCPDSTYWHIEDIEPAIHGDTLTVYSGHGTRRSSWGIPRNDAIIALNDIDLTSVVIWSSFKYRGFQTWRHYKDGQKVQWRQLSDIDRQRILDSWIALKDGWVKCPGKLAAYYNNRKDPPHKQLEITENGIIGYKYLVPVVFMDSTVDVTANLKSPTGDLWRLGQLTADKIPTMENTHGIYAAKHPEWEGLRFYRDYGRVLVKIVCSGVVIESEFGFRAEFAKVVEVLK